MRKTKANNVTESPFMLTTQQLMEKLNCGYKTAVQIGADAKARIYLGRRVWFCSKKIEEYLNKIAV